MDEHDWLAERFEAERPHLRAVTYRMLGSLAEIDDAVQESWLRLSRADTSGIENLGGWLTTVIARVCLDQLRARRGARSRSQSSSRGIQTPRRGVVRYRSTSRLRRCLTHSCRGTVYRDVCQEGELGMRARMVPRRLCLYPLLL